MWRVGSFSSVHFSIRPITSSKSSSEMTGTTTSSFSLPLGRAAPFKPAAPAAPLDDVPSPLASRLFSFSHSSSCSSSV